MELPRVIVSITDTSRLSLQLPKSDMPEPRTLIQSALDDHEIQSGGAVATDAQ
jgi:nitrogen fixation protein